MKLKNMNTKPWTPQQRIAWLDQSLENHIRARELDEQGNPDPEIQAMIAEDQEANNYYKD